MGIEMKPKTILGACGAGFLAGLLLAIIGGAMVSSATCASSTQHLR
jgi:hypothetical protein